MTSKLFAVFGAGGHARVVSSIIRALGGEVYGFFDDSFAKAETIQAAPLRGTFADITQCLSTTKHAALALGDNVKRQKAFRQLQQWGFLLPTLLHPRANIEVDAQVGEGTVVCLGAMLGTESFVGRGSIVNTGAVIDHESSLGDFSHIAPGAVIAGRTRIGHKVFVGMNACIADGLRVGDNSIIGAGSIVLADVPEGAKILGIHH
jgi:sugar O-acyltransferase (sialic acid O-acetyltransferase NeuD family)